MVLDNLIISIFFFILGTFVGSFLNCVIFRLEKGKSFLKGRSFCDHCQHPLSFFDLIPIFSFIFFKGKCRYCSQKISLQYPLVEFFAGFLFFLTFLKFSQNLFLLFFYLLIFSFLILIFVFDAKHLFVPDQILYPPVIIAFFYKMSKFSPKDLFSFFSPFFLALFLLLLILISKERWFGWGDFFLAFLMGEILNFEQTIFATLFAFWSGASISLILVFLKKKTFKSQIPFCPFLISGTFLSILFPTNSFFR